MKNGKIKDGGSAVDVDVNSEKPKKEEDGSTRATFKQLFRYATKTDYALLAFGMIFGLAQGSMNSVASVIFRHLTDSLIEGQVAYDLGLFDYNSFEASALVAIKDYALFGTGVFALGFLSMCCWHTLCERQIKVIRDNYFAAVLRQDMKWFDRHESGMLTTKMSEGMDRIKDGMGDKLGALFTYTANFIAGLTVAFSLSWKMSLVILCFMPLFFGPMVITAKFIGKIAPKEQKTVGKAGAVAEEVITGIRTVIAFNGQRKEISRYNELLLLVRKLGIRRAFLTTFGVSFIMLAMFVSMAVSFYFGTTLVIAGEVSPGTTFAVFWAVIGGAFAIGQAAPNIGVIMGALSAAKPIFDIIDRVPEIDSKSPEGQNLENPRGDIEFDGIHFRYPTRSEAPILKGVTISIKSGQHVAFVGHSGCGKSTLMGLLLRYYEHERGRVKIDGIDVSDINIHSLRSVVGVVSQEPALFADTIENNLRLGKLDLTSSEMISVCKMANAHDFIMKLPDAYQTYIGDGGVQLSGGQKQRVAIARALARNPRILLLDEATSALDTESESIVQMALEAAQSGRTTISIAHRLSTIRNVDCIYVFDKGHVVESGTHEELMAKDGVYTQLVRAQEIEKQEESTEKKIETIPEDDELPGKFTRSANNASTASRMSKRLSRAVSSVSNSVVDADIGGLEAQPMLLAEAAEREVEDRIGVADVDMDELEQEKASPSSLMTIIRYAREEWWMLIVGLIFSIVRGLTFPLFSIVYGKMFTTLSSADNDAKLAGARINAVYFALIGIMSWASTNISGFLYGRAGEYLTGRMRKALFTNIVQQDGEYFDQLEHSSGRLTTRLATDAPNIRAAIDQRLADVLQAISAIVAAIVIAFTYSAVMAPVGILTAVSLMCLQTLIAQYLKRKAQKDAVKAEEPSRLATEAIELHKTVAYLTREDHFVEEFKRGMKGVHRRTLIRGVIQSITYALSVSFINYNFAAAYRYGLWLVYINKATPYIVFQVIEALNVASISLIAFATYFPEYVRARMSAGLLFNMLTVRAKIDSLNEDGDRPTLTGEIQLNKTFFSYPSRRNQLILRGMNLTVKPGQTVALVGPSGCGKSTIIQLLERFYDPTVGSVQFDGNDSRRMNVQHLRSQMSLVGQEPVLFNYSIRENIAYGCENATQEEIEAAAKLANAHNFITSLPAGYDTCVGEKGGQLSGGQKQRIAIARAVIRKPKILLLDEATSALDTESEKIVQEALDHAREGRTCIVVAHRLSSIQNSDLIAVCKDGKVHEIGNHQQLLALNGLYAGLIERQKLD